MNTTKKIDLISKGQQREQLDQPNRLTNSRANVERRKAAGRADVAGAWIKPPDRI